MMLWSSLPDWSKYLLDGLMLFSVMACSAVVLSRAGKSPYWALFTVVPYAVIIAVWFFAFTTWPKVDGAPQEKA